MTKRKASQNGAGGLLNDGRIRRVHHEDHTYYCVTDLIRVLTETEYPDEYWADLKKREPALGAIEEWMEVEKDGAGETIPAVDAAGVYRVVQSITSPAAERVKRWLADSAIGRLEEMENPELTVLRMRKAYEEQGYSPKWIDKRLRGISTRQEVTSEWARRGVSESDQYRALTNAIMDGTFGMDVERLRRYKNLQRPTQNLRDYMSDLELVLTSLGETAAVVLHRNRGSSGFEELMADATEAGRIAGAARTQIEQGSARKPRRRESHRASTN
jgi:prophage antirepressor-like protein